MSCLMKKKSTRKEERVQETRPDAGGLEEMQRAELTGDEENDSLEVSDTDDDEDEGVGDGKMGRDKDDPFAK
jgi:hypothetical protein